MRLTREARLAESPASRTESGDLVIDMAFSSELPYERWWGIEVLDHSEGAIRLGRLNDGAPILYNHDWSDLRGVHEPGSVRAEADGVLRGKARLTAATQAGRDAIALVEGGVLTKASVGYEIHKVIEQSTAKDGRAVSREIAGDVFGRALSRCQRESPGDIAAFRRVLDTQAGPFERAADSVSTFRVTDWEPLENSLVTVPADPSVGVGRSAEPETPTPIAPPVKELQMQAENPTPGVDVAAVEAAARASAGEAAHARVSELLAYKEQFKAFDVDGIVDQALRNNTPMAEFIKVFNAHVAQRGTAWQPEIGMTKKEAQRFSLCRALNAMVTGDWTSAGLEREASRAMEAKLTSIGVQRSGTGKGFFIPIEVQQRDMLVATAANGGNMVATDLRPQDFIGILRNRMLSRELGVRILSGLVGNADITKHTGAGTGYWLSSETTAITESQQTLGLLPLRPKTLGAYTEITRLLMLQSTPDVDAFVMDDLAQVIALAVDAAIFNGSGGSGQPTGIIGTSGVGAVTGTTLGLGGLIEFQTDVAGANALNSGCAYVTTPAVAGLLAQRARIASTDSITLWKGNVLDGEVEGYRARSSNNLPAATMIFGDFRQAILAEWGVLEIDINPYANFVAGISGIRAFYTCDVGVRVPGAFSVAGTIT